MASRDAVVRYCDELLQTSTFRDIALNGLQIEGRSEIQRMTTAVSCNLETIEAAIENQSDTILVHHGLVLNGQVGDIRGPVRWRLKRILENDLNLIGYHLPLDGHPEIGNNARLAESLGLTITEPLETYGPPAVGYIGTAEGSLTFDQLSSRLETVTGQPVIVLNPADTPVERVAVMCGSGAPALNEAAEKGCQVLVTGDAREPTMALARELGVSVLIGGHEATERLGVQALAERLATEFGVDHQFYSDPNPL